MSRELGKLLVVFGVALVGVGALLIIELPRGWGWLGRLPGDILVKRDNFTFYFPLATSLLVSALLSLLLWLVSRFRS